MDDISINTNDEIIIKLLHYFVTEENYSPIVLKGAQNEIWLEKLDGDYKVVRLVSNYIHNNEQLNVDLFRTKQIMKRIKKKTMSFSLNALSIFVNLGDNVNISEAGNADIDCVKVSEVEDLNNYEFILDNFPTITKKTVFKEEGMELFVRLTNEIGKKNEKEQKQAEDIFAPKDPIVTKVLLTINFIIFIACILGIGDTIVNLGVNHLGSVQHGQLWRLVTAGFIHVNLMHFAFNAYALYLIGPQIEQFYGRTKYLIIYIGSIIIGNLLSLLFLGGNVSLGASAGIFGLLGAILYFGYHYHV